MLTGRDRVQPKVPEGLTLDQVRPNLRPGDVILFQGRYLVSNLYRFATGGDWYTHAAIVAGWDDDWILLQAEAAGVQAVELRNAVKKYDGLSDWYALTPDCRKHLSLDVLLREARRNLGVPFGVVQFLLHLGHWWLGLTMPRTPRRPPAYFCSQYVAHCFSEAGVELTAQSAADTMPDDISRSYCLERIGPIRLA